MARPIATRLGARHTAPAGDTWGGYTSIGHPRSVSHSTLQSYSLRPRRLSLQRSNCRHATREQAPRGVVPVQATSTSGDDKPEPRGSDEHVDQQQGDSASAAEPASPSSGPMEPEGPERGPLSARASQLLTLALYRDMFNMFLFPNEWRQSPVLPDHLLSQEEDGQEEEEEELEEDPEAQPLSEYNARSPYSSPSDGDDEIARGDRGPGSASDEAPGGSRPSSGEPDDGGDKGEGEWSAERGAAREVYQYCWYCGTGGWPCSNPVCPECASASPQARGGDRVSSQLRGVGGAEEEAAPGPAGAEAGTAVFLVPAERMLMVGAQRTVHVYDRNLLLALQHARRGGGGGELALLPYSTGPGATWRLGCGVAAVVMHGTEGGVAGVRTHRRSAVDGTASASCLVRLLGVRRVAPREIRHLEPFVLLEAVDDLAPLARPPEEPAEERILELSRECGELRRGLGLRGVLPPPADGAEDDTLIDPRGCVQVLDEWRPPGTPRARSRPPLDSQARRSPLGDLFEEGDGDEHAARSLRCLCASQAMEPSLYAGMLELAEGPELWTYIQDGLLETRQLLIARKAIADLDIRDDGDATGA